MKGTQGFARAPVKAAILVTAVFSQALTGCLSDGEGDYDSAWVGDIKTDVNVSGSVGDGPLVNASVTIRKKNGEELASGVTAARPMMSRCPSASGTSHCLSM
jgi:hypothetical protein